VFEVRHAFSYIVQPTRRCPCRVHIHAYVQIVTLYMSVMIKVFTIIIRFVLNAELPLQKSYKVIRECVSNSARYNWIDRICILYKRFSINFNSTDSLKKHTSYIHIREFDVNRCQQARRTKYGKKTIPPIKIFKEVSSVYIIMYTHTHIFIVRIILYDRDIICKRAGIIL